MVCYTLLLTPAILGAALQWSRAITAPLLLPGIVMQICLAYLTARPYGIHYRPPTLPVGQRLVLGGFYGLLGGVAINIRPTYLAPLCLAIVLVFIIDPMSRIAWKRARTSTT